MTRPASDSQIRLPKMADMIASRIRQMIARGELADGEWLPTEPELMERFGVSRPTLREALRLLEADSLVTIRRGPPGGARVTIPGPEAAAPQFGLLLTLAGTTLQDVYEACAAIEPPAVRRIAERGTAADRRQIAGLVDELRANTDDLATFGRLATALHVTLVRMSGNETLATVIGMLMEIVNRHLARTFVVTEESPDPATDNRRAVRAYDRLLDLLAARDGPGAEKLWQKHMRAAGQYILRNIDTNAVDLLE